MEHAGRGTAIAQTIAHAAAGCAILLLAGCALLPLDDDETPMPVPTESGSSASATPQPGSVGGTAEITIAGADVDGLTVTVSGFVPALLEDGGLCRFVMTSATGTQVVAESEGVGNVNSTSCGTQTVPIDQFTRGSWNVQLTYSSASGTRVSDVVPMEIP